MAIELRQQLKLSQSLVMTPQLQQAIRLLQLSRLELIDEIENVLDIQCAPVTWPVGSGQHFGGTYHLQRNELIAFERDRPSDKLYEASPTLEREDPRTIAHFGAEGLARLDDEIELIEKTGKLSDQLDIAADKAHRLTVALRSRGVDAYEFHDRSESYVAVGSFDSVGEPLANGTIDINPTIHKIMKMYSATPHKLPGGGSMGLQPRTLSGIRFDIQAVPIEVPRRSIASDYARAASR